MMLGKKEKISPPVEYYRSRSLCLFSLFQINKRDACELLSALEYLDQDFSQTVSVIALSETFCPHWKETFQAIWRRFIIVFNESRKRTEEEFLERNPLIRRERERERERGKGEKENEFKEYDYNANYIEILSFIFFLVSIPDLWSSFWLYWLWYTLPGTKITRAGLIDMLDILWGISKSKGKECKEHRVLLRPIIKYIEPDDFDSKRFQLCDWRCHGGFTSPFRQMRKELMKTIGKKDLWNRIIEKMNEVISSPSLVVVRLGERRVSGSLSRTASVSHPLSTAIFQSHINGERKESWYEIRDYLEAFLRFHTMMRADPPEPKGPLSRLIFSVSNHFHHSIQTIQMILPSKKKLPIIKQSGSNTLLREGEGEREVPDDTSLTKIYKKSLKMSVKKLHQLSEIKRERGLAGLERCQEELAIKIDYGEEEKKEKEGEGESVSEGSSIVRESQKSEKGGRESQKSGSGKGESQKGSSKYSKTPPDPTPRQTQEEGEEEGEEEEEEEYEDEEEEYEEGEEEGEEEEEEGEAEVEDDIEEIE